MDHCLSLDESLGLGVPGEDASESCCLVTPPGHAILDTGCTSTLVGSENEKLWREELLRVTKGNLKPEKGPSEVRFEGINGESTASYQVKYPVRIANRDGFIQAAVIPGKAPFLLSIKALRQMRAKLDCENDTLTIPGIGVVNLLVNGVGHYMLPLLDFSSSSADAEHSFSSATMPTKPPGLEPIETSAAEVERTSFGSEGIAEDLTRHGALPEGSSQVDLQGGSDEPAKAGDLPHVVPDFQSVVNRRESYARSVLLTLGKETHGPWIPMPENLRAVYVVLGGHGYTPDQHEPWQVRAAQIGYKAKIVRRPPVQMKGSWTLVMANLEVVQDWTASDKCSGQSLEPTCANARLCLFVYAYLPGTHDHGFPEVGACKETSSTNPKGPKARKGVLSRVTSATSAKKGHEHSKARSQVHERVFVSTATSAAVVETPAELPECDSDTEPFVPCLENDIDDECFGGSDPVPAQMFTPGRSRNAGATTLQSLRHASDGSLRKQIEHHLSLQAVSTLSHMQREGPANQQPQREDHVLPPQGLLEHVCSSRSNCLPRRRPGQGCQCSGQYQWCALPISTPSCSGSDSEACAEDSGSCQSPRRQQRGQFQCSCQWRCAADCGATGHDAEICDAETIQKELGGAVQMGAVNPVNPDVAMRMPLTPEVQQEIGRLEEEAAALLSRAAYLRQSVGLPSSRQVPCVPKQEGTRATPPSQGVMPPGGSSYPEMAPMAPTSATSATSSTAQRVPTNQVHYDPDSHLDGWEFAPLL